jgi:hypothetical protein
VPQTKKGGCFTNTTAFIEKQSNYNNDSGTLKYKERAVMVCFERDFDRDIQHRKSYKTKTAKAQKL